MKFQPIKAGQLARTDTFFRSRPFLRLESNMPFVSFYYAVCLSYFIITEVNSSAGSGFPLCCMTIVKIEEDKRKIYLFQQNSLFITIKTKLSDNGINYLLLFFNFYSPFLAFLVDSLNLNINSYRLETWSNVLTNHFCCVLSRGSMCRSDAMPEIAFLCYLPQYA